MTIQEALEKLQGYEKATFALNHATGLMYYDGATTAPKGTAELRGSTLGELSRMGLDDLDVNHGIGEHLPQICNCYDIARLQAVYVPKVIRTMPPSMSGNDAVGTHAANRHRSVPKHRRPCGKVRIRRAQVDRHDQLQRGYLQYTYDLVLHAVVFQQYSRLLTGQSVGQSRLPLCINALVISLQVCQQLGI